MNKFFLFICGYLIFNFGLYGQNKRQNIIYIIDSVPVLQDPEYGNEINDADFTDIITIRNKDSLRVLSLSEYDEAVYLFSKEYRNRSEEQKLIPSTYKMYRLDGVWYYQDQLYSGKFIDYYYNGKKHGEGTIINGNLEGRRLIFHQNGNLSVDRMYVKGKMNGDEILFYENGTIMQKGIFYNNKREGVWEKYYPNGQVKQRSTFVKGKFKGKTTFYYSSGKILSVGFIKVGETSTDKKLDKLNKALDKGTVKYQGRDITEAISEYSKAIEKDDTNAEAYLARGTFKLNDLAFDEAILDFNKAILIEPYYERAISYRAIARIRKNQMEHSWTTSKKHFPYLGLKDNIQITAKELEAICNDISLSIFLGAETKLILDAANEFCRSNNIH